VTGRGLETDYVIVGAGSAGSVLTRRLIDAGFSVHLLEAGGPDDDPAVHSLAGWMGLLGGGLDWAQLTIPQRHADNRQLFWPRGKMLGGCSSLNAMFYIRGHADDYDGWAQTVGDPAWAWDNALAVFKRSEAHESGDSEYHGATGPQQVSSIVSPHPLSMAFLDAAVAAGHKRIADFNGADMNGAGLVELTARNGKRRSAWRSFAAPVADHPKLTITTGALVHRVLIENGRAVGVEYSTRDAAPMRAYCDAEVLLCGGVLGSPKALLLSGIGPADELSSVGVDTVVELPGVGKNLHDHVLVSIVYKSASALPAATNNLLEAHLFSRSSVCAGPAPDLQSLIVQVPYTPDGSPGPEHGYAIIPGLVAPRSRGELRLASADPGEPPLADPNVLADPADLEALADGIEICREIGASEHFAPWREAELAPGAGAQARAQLRSFIRRSVGTFHHQVGTCKMGAPGDADAVVGPDLRVRGVDGLRVADASIMPTIPHGNTNAPAMMIGERASDLILGRT
jgi:choline dehydrogenase